MNLSQNKVAWKIYLWRKILALIKNLFSKILLRKKNIKLQTKLYLNLKKIKKNSIVKTLLKKRIKVQVILILMKMIRLKKFKLPILSQQKKERNAKEEKNAKNLLKIWRKNFGKTKRKPLNKWLKIHWKSNHHPSSKVLLKSKKKIW